MLGLGGLGYYGSSFRRGMRWFDLCGEGRGLVRVEG